mgnify:CR=1 FL=1
MVENDTVKLLRECDAGIKMGVAAIDDVMSHVHGEEFRKSLNACRDEHENLRVQVREMLSSCGDDGKEPNPIAKGMSWIKTNVKMGMDNSDQTIAELITDGCNMGVKSLNQYLNQYKAADEVSKDIAKRLIQLEERLAVDIRKFL